MKDIALITVLVLAGGALCACGLSQRCGSATGWEATTQRLLCEGGEKVP